MVPEKTTLEKTEGPEIVEIRKSLLRSILESARAVYPRETILLLRGISRKRRIEITDIIIPPLATYGNGFSSFPTHMLPIDFSLVGTVHSHPSGSGIPSVQDLNRSFGKIMIIVFYPFHVQNVTIYSRSGEKIPLRIIK